MNNRLWIAYARHFMRWVGWSGTLGVLLLVVTPVLWLGLVLPQEDSLSEMQERVRANRAAIAVKREALRPAPASEGDRLDSYLRGFPPEAQAPEQLRKMFEAADKAKVVLSNGEYMTNDVQGSHIRRLRVTLPVRGGMAPIQSFIDGVLKGAPNCALQDVNFKRDKIDDAEIEARLVFVFFVNTTS